MARFTYKAFDRSGRINAGNTEAASVNELEANLAERGLTAFHVLLEREGVRGSHRSAPDQAQEYEEPWWFREIGGERKPTEAEIASLASELAMLTTAGIGIDQALAMAAETRRGAARRTARRLRDLVMEGRSLSEAMRADAVAFSEELVAMVLAAEAAADLPGGLERLAALLARRRQLATEMRSALVYPAVLLAASLGVLLVVVNVLIPNLRPLFDEARTPMPAFIRLLDAAQAAARDHWLAIALAIAAGYVLGHRVLRLASVRQSIDRSLLKLPLAAGVIKRSEAARFARALGAQLVSGVSLLTAIGIAAQSLRNGEIRERTLGAIERIRDGVAPSQALREIAAFPASMPQLVAVGEGSGRLGPVLLQLAESFEQAQQVAVRRAMSLLTPLLTLGLGMLVGTLMLSLMNAITGLNDFALR